MSYLVLFLFTVLSFSLSFAQTETTTERKSILSNPEISVNTLITGTAGSEGNNANSESPNGFNIQEVELRLTSNIDAYFRGDITLAVEKEDGEFIVEPEEVFVETIALDSISVKAGKFYALLGRHNNLHTHSFPFIDQPLTNEVILGEEGLNEAGIALSYLAPTPWYLEFVAQGFSAKNENLFNTTNNDNMAGVLFVKNLWELNDASTVEFDLGYGNGRNEFGGDTHLYNASLTYKWRPVENSTSKSFSWTAEFLQSHREKAIDNIRTEGVSTWAQWQLSKHWWLQGRGEFLKMSGANDGDMTKYSALVGYIPTEYSAIRLQYDNLSQDGVEDDEHKVTLQLNVTFGSHPAHNY